MKEMSISIIMPIYNGETGYINNIESFIISNYSNVELVIVLPDSIDCDVVSKCNELSRLHSSITVIEKMDVFRNEIDIGLQSSCGEYVLILRANDKLSDGTINKTLEVINNNHPDVIFLHESIGSYDDVPSLFENELFVLDDINSSDIWVDLYIHGILNNQHAICNKSIINGLNINSNVYNFRSDYAETLVNKARILSYDSRNQYIVNGYHKTEGKELVSIIVPVYNAAPYLRQCLNSLIDQSYSNMEIILLLRDSKDDSSKICEEYEKKDNRIVVYKQNDNALGIVRNQGIALAKGRYIYQCDADDYLENNAIERMYDVAETSNADLVEFEYRKVDDNNIILEQDSFYLVAKKLGHDYRERYGDVSVWRYFLKKRFWEENNLCFNRVLPGEDLTINSLIFALSRNTRLIPDVLYNYRIHEGSITTSNNEGFSYVRDTIRQIPAIVINSFKTRCIYEQNRNTLSCQLERNMASIIKKYSNSLDEYYKELRGWKYYFDKYAGVRNSDGNYYILIGRKELQNSFISIFARGITYSECIPDCIPSNILNEITDSKEIIIIIDFVEEYKRFLKGTGDIDSIISSIVFACERFLAKVKNYNNSTKLIVLEDRLSRNYVNDREEVHLYKVHEDISVLNEVIDILYQVINRRYADSIIIKTPDYLQFSSDERFDSINIYKRYWLRARFSDVLHIWDDKADVNKIKDIKKYETDRIEYIRQSRNHTAFLYTNIDELPCLSDYREEAGSIDGHYLFQDIYVAKKVSCEGIKHIWDIGSRVDGYISHLLSMDIKVTLIDVRPLSYRINGLDFVQDNACGLLTISDESIDNLSSLHALEHFGLGRYGDNVDYLGYKKAIEAFKRVLKKGGLLFLSVPVGKKEKVMFNAHRIFSPTTIVNEFGNSMKIQEFTYIQNGNYIKCNFEKETDAKNIIKVLSDIQNQYLGDYDCGIFIFKKV